MQLPPSPRGLLLPPPSPFRPTTNSCMKVNVWADTKWKDGFSKSTQKARTQAQVSRHPGLWSASSSCPGTGLLKGRGLHGPGPQGFDRR